MVAELTQSYFESGAAAGPDKELGLLWPAVLDPVGSVGFAFCSFRWKCLMFLRSGWVGVGLV
jgi:hypothetical protein